MCPKLCVSSSVYVSDYVLVICVLMLVGTKIKLPAVHVSEKCVGSMYSKVCEDKFFKDLAYICVRRCMKCVS